MHRAIYFVTPSQCLMRASLFYDFKLFRGLRPKILQEIRCYFVQKIRLFLSYFGVPGCFFAYPSIVVSFFSETPLLYGTSLRMMMRPFSRTHRICLMTLSKCTRDCSAFLFSFVSGMVKYGISLFAVDKLLVLCDKKSSVTSYMLWLQRI